MSYLRAMGDQRPIKWKDDDMAETQDCACPDCTCKAAPDTAVMKDGEAYCSEACAEDHPNGAGCGHAGCACKG